MKSLHMYIVHIHMRGMIDDRWCFDVSESPSLEVYLDVPRHTWLRLHQRVIELEPF